MNNKIYVLISLIILILIGFTIIKPTDTKEDIQSQETINTSKPKAIVYKSPLCGCCGSYSKQLESEGYDVEIIKTEDMASIKDKYNIPEEMESCHTTVIGDYFIEGHVPFEALTKLFEEKPEIDGIALPDMPAGTPGMPGVKINPYEIYQLIDGNYSNYLTL